MHITTKFVSSNSTHDEVYLIEHYENKFVNNLSKVGCFLRSHQFPTPIQTDHHNIAEMFLKVVLNTFLCLYSKKSKVGETWTYHLEAKSILTFCLFCQQYMISLWPLRAIEIMRSLYIPPMILWNHNFG
jgi:hypothetical protein